MIEALLSIIAGVESNQGIPGGLLQAICTVESGLNPEAVRKLDGVSSHNSLGLCQVQPRTAKWICGYNTEKSLFDPRRNAECAAKYLRYQYKRYGSWDAAVIAYNKGNWAGGKTNSYLEKVKHVRSNQAKNLAN